jgi:hypothetical protein
MLISLKLKVVGSSHLAVIHKLPPGGARFILLDLLRRSTHPALWAPLRGGDFPKLPTPNSQLPHD